MRRLPEQGLHERRAPPFSPTCDGAPVDAKLARQFRQRRPRSAVHQHRNEQYGHGDIDPAPEKPQRRRCRTLSAVIFRAAQAQALAIEFPGLRRHSPGLARIIRRVELAAAVASLLPCGLRQIVVELDQQLMEADVVDKLLVQPLRVNLYPRSQMTTKTGRNQPCPCGSGKKFKQCCLRKEEEAEHKAMAALNQARQEGRGGTIRIS